MFTPHHIRPPRPNLVQVLCLADDLTGALEVGSKFAACGLVSTVTTSLALDDQPRCDVLVIDAESRHLPETEAFELIRHISAQAARLHPRLIFKKTDSTLRGNIAAELRAMQAVFPNQPLLFAPAYPAVGRTVREGHLYVDGTLLHETEFALDPLNPVRHSDIKRLLDNDTIVVLDGESHREVIEAARMIVEADLPALAAGSAGLAEALAARLSSRTPAPPTLPTLGRCLVVNGSLHPASHQQILLAQAQQCFRGDWLLLEETFPGKGLERARHLGERVRTILHAANFDGLIVFGGDTAIGIHRALHAPDFQPQGEILPGVPLSYCEGLYWITKAGGFGAPHLLQQLYVLLAGDNC